jgi:hypothetical protein
MEINSIGCQTIRRTRVLSVGGNDAMLEISVLKRPVEHISEALTKLRHVVDRFDTSNLST